MSLTSGNFFAIPVNKEDPVFQTIIDVKPDSRIVSAKRVSEIIAEPQQNDDLAALKNQLQGGIEELKKGGWQGAKTLLQKLIKQVISELTGDKKSKPATTELRVDPLDPINAFALPLPDKGIGYEPIRNLADKDKDLDYYEFRSKNSYGLLFKVADNVFKEVIFTYPSSEYADHYYPEQSVSSSVSDWRREDANLHKMRVYFLSTDKALAEKHAQAANLDEEKQGLFAVDKTSTRAGERTRFSIPDLTIDARTKEVSVNFLDAWYLPTQTKEGRQIQYNWDALRIIVRQGDKIIKRQICWSKSRKRAYIESVKTTFELMDAGRIGEMEPGNYTFEVYIYDEKYLSYPFEVMQVDSTDTLSEPGSYFVIKAWKDAYAQLSFDEKGHDLYCHYPMKTLLDTHASTEEFNIALRITTAGKAWPTWKWTPHDSIGNNKDIKVRNNPNWCGDDVRLAMLFGNQEDHNGRKPAPNGKYTIHIDVDGKEVDKIEFAFKDGEFVADKTLPDIGLANVDIPKEHLGFLFPLQSVRKGA